MLSLEDYKALSSKVGPLCQDVAQWLARFVRDPDVYMIVLISVLRRGEAQWLASLVWYEDVDNINPLTPTNYSLYIVNAVVVLPINSLLPSFGHN